MYRFLRNILFLFPPETVHYFSMNAFRIFCRFGPARKLFGSWFCPGGQGLEKMVWGLRFRNMVGLGAGFDKNALYLDELQTMGFGFVEIGTVTPLAQPGNEKPRLFRLPRDKALINRMGFNNDGAVAVAARLKKWRNKNPDPPPGEPGRMLVGGNIGKNKITANEDAWKDYATCFSALYEYVDYFVVNVSSPNTPGLRALQQKDSLRKILLRLQELNREKRDALVAGPRPLLLKIAPDLTREELEDIIELALEIHLDGIVATNTTIDRASLGDKSKVRSDEIGPGGLSGRPLMEKSTSVLAYIHEKTKGSIPLVASGGIFNENDAMRKISAGATLLQVWTGFIYEGPMVVKKILGHPVTGR